MSKGGSGTRPSKPLAEEMDSGSTISSYTKHESGSNYTVHVKDKSGTEHVYTNVTNEHLRGYLGRDPENGGGEGESGGGGGRGRSGSHGGGKKGEESPFDSLMKSGGKVQDIKETKRGTYAVHVLGPDGKTHNFSSVGGDHLESYGVDLGEAQAD